MSTTAIIIAGGKSTRMKVNKALLELNNKPMLQIIIDNLKDYFPNLLLVTNEPNLYDKFNIQKISDIMPGHGPLSGMHAGLSNSTTERNFIVACDMPFVNGALASYICNHKGEWDVVTPKLGNYYEPLFAAYKKACIPYLENSILNNEHKSTTFYKDVNVNYITREEILQFGDPEKIFSNINTPDEYINLLTKGR